MKYKVGDTVNYRNLKPLHKFHRPQLGELYVQLAIGCYDFRPGTVLRLFRDDGTNCPKFTNGSEWHCEYWHRLALLPINNKGATMRRTFKLLKDTDILKKGALFQEMCDDGDQDYVLLDDAFRRFEYPHSAVRCVRGRDAIENNPKWYIEVFPMVSEYGTKEEVNAFKKFLGKR